MSETKQDPESPGITGWMPQALVNGGGLRVDRVQHVFDTAATDRNRAARILGPGIFCAYYAPVPL